MNDWIAKLYQDPDLIKMGHAQRAEDLNLGLGWIYYALARVIRPKLAVVIGSFRGFGPMVLAKALSDNVENGRLLFIDPSLVNGQWRDPEAVAAHFASYGIHNIEHRLMTTQQYVETPEYAELREVGLVFVDGYHSAEQAAFDYGAFEDRMSADGMILLHDSIWQVKSKIYGEGKHYDHTVVDFVAELKTRPELQVFDLPFGRGVTLVRKSATPLGPR